MKRTVILFLALMLFLSFESNAQVQVDHPVQLTGSGTNAKLTGIQNVSANQDAVSVDYLQRDSLQFALAGGSSNGYTVNLSPAVTGQYTVGMVVHFIAGFTNTGSATLAVNNLLPAVIKKNYNTNLDSADIKSGQAVSVLYDGTDFQMLSQLGNSGAGNSGTVVSHGKQLFTSSGTFTVPAGVDTVWVSMSGGGGGGGGGTSINSPNPVVGGAGGGGGAAVISQPLAVTPLATYNITIGAGGAGGSGSIVTGYLPDTGIAGAASSFGILLTVHGGGGGGGYYGAGGTAGGSGGAAGQSGILVSSGNYSDGGNGGGSMFGAGGYGGRGGGSNSYGYFVTSSNPGALYGAGGGGGHGGGTSGDGYAGDNGANGAAGFVLVEW